MAKKTREAQYSGSLDQREQRGVVGMGTMAGWAWEVDPRRVFFALARYKFVSKMLSGAERVLEIGCGDAFYSRMVLQEVKHLTAVDFEPEFVKDAQTRAGGKWPFTCLQHDILQGPVPGTFDAAFALDFLEHIPQAREDDFLRNVCSSLKDDGTLIIGTPSLESQPYASEESKAGHINCKDAQALKALMSRYFRSVFLFSMNDEVVHTGFAPMAHFRFALCVGKKPAS